MGVDYIEVTTNRVVRAKLNRIGLTEVGDISWPEHGYFYRPGENGGEFQCTAYHLGRKFPERVRRTCSSR